MNLVPVITGDIRADVNLETCTYISVLNPVLCRRVYVWIDV